MKQHVRERAVLLVDMDAFFASVAIRLRPYLAGEAVIVGGRAEQRGVVSSCNYLARRYGVRSAMPTAEAQRRCPQAIVLPVDGPAVRAASRAVRTILGEYSDVIEAASVDEFYLDMSGSERLFGSAEQVARTIQQRIAAGEGLPCSIGGGTNKLIAKIATEAAKPGGIQIVPAGAESAFLAPLPVGALPGVGPKSVAALGRHGIDTCGAVASCPASLLTRLFGAHGAELRERALGRDDRPVRSERRRKQISHEQTFHRDTRDAPFLEATLREQAEALASKLRAGGLAAATVGIKLRWADWETVTRQTTLAQPADMDEAIYSAARDLLHTVLRERRSPVRLLGLAASGLQPRQLTLLVDDERARRLAAAKDTIRARWGGRALRRAQVLGMEASESE